MIPYERTEQLIEAIRPELHKAIDAVAQGKAVDIFDLMTGTNSKTGIKTHYVCFVCHEGLAALLEKTIEGWERCNKMYEALVMQAESPEEFMASIGGIDNAE